MPTWLITGCSTGLGRHLAKAVLERGYNAVVRGGSVCLNTFAGVSKWLRRPFQAAAGIGVARLMYA